MRLKYILINMSVVNYNKHFLVVAVKNIYITRDADNTDARALCSFMKMFSLCLFFL